MGTTLVSDLLFPWTRSSHFEQVPRRVAVAGLLYFHRITDNRYAASMARFQKTLAKLTGSPTLEKMTLLQTMWDTVKLDIGQRRDKELQDNFWKPLVAGGASVEQFRDTTDEAWAVVSRCVKVHAGADAMLLREEMANARKRVGESSAVKGLYSDYLRLLDQKRQRMCDVQLKEMSGETLARVEKEIQDLDSKLNKTFQDLRKLKVTVARRFILMFKGTSKAWYVIQVLPQSLFRSVISAERQAMPPFAVTTPTSS